jgi:phage portal protein BeeE
MRAFTVPGRRLGMSVISRHATVIGQGLAASAFGLRWFLDGAHPSSILQNEDEPIVDETTAQLVKRRFMAAVRGTREPVVIGKGWKYQQIQVNAEESQFLDTQRYTAAECARIFGPGIAEVLGYETGGSLTYANVEQLQTDLMTRYQAYDFGLRGQWTTINEVRAMEDKAPVAWGDQPLGVVGKASLQVPLETPAAEGDAQGVDQQGGVAAADQATSGKG